jgi:hypothetical protein
MALARFYPRTPQSMKGNPVPVRPKTLAMTRSKLAARYGVSVDAFMFMSRRSPAPFKLLRQRNSDGEVEYGYGIPEADDWLLEPVFRTRDLMRWLGLNRGLINQLYYACPCPYPYRDRPSEGPTAPIIRLYPRIYLAHLYDYQQRMAAIPLLDDTRVALSNLAVSAMGESGRRMLLELADRYGVDLRKPEPRRRPEFPFQLIDTVTVEIAERLLEVLEAYAPEGWFTVLELARYSGRSQNHVLGHIAQTGAFSQKFRLRNGGLQDHYRLSALPDLKPAAFYPSAGSWLTINRMARILGRSDAWVQDRVQVRSGEYRRGKLRQVRLCFPPSELERLQHLDQQTPLSEDWLTVNQLATTLGKSVTWVEGRVRVRGSEMRERTAHTGRPERHYPPSELARLVALRDELKPAEDWVTEWDMYTQLGCDPDWVRARLNFDLGEERLTTRIGKATVHYPPCELERLRRIWVAFQQMQPPNNWLTSTQIAKAVGRSVYWVDRFVQASSGEERKFPDNRVFVCYPPRELERLRGLCTETPPAGDWSTLTSLVQTTGRSLKWLQRRANPAVAERRRDTKGRVFDHYPPEEIERLKDLARTAPRRQNQL